MVISTKANFSKENGTEEEKYYFLTQQYKKGSGFKTKNNEMCALIKKAKNISSKGKIGFYSIL